MALENLATLDVSHQSRVYDKRVIHVKLKWINEKYRVASPKSNAPSQAGLKHIALKLELMSKRP